MTDPNMPWNKIFVYVVGTHTQYGQRLFANEKDAIRCAEDEKQWMETKYKTKMNPYVDDGQPSRYVVCWDGFAESYAQMLFVHVRKLEVETKYDPPDEEPK